MLTAIGFDLSGCSLLTKASCTSLLRVQGLKVVNFSNCPLIDDSALKELTPLAANLEVLSLAGLPQISNEGLDVLAQKCKHLRLLNVSNCGRLTHDVMVMFAKNNKRLSTLHASATRITDDGLSMLCTSLSGDFLLNVDLSFCRDITDFGIITLSQVCPNIKSMNLCSVSRVTDTGVQHLLANCWKLEDLNLEDIFLLDNRAFWFNSTFDGRPAANELMLKSLINVNLKDCVNLSTHGLLGISERCRKIEQFILSGCEKVSNDSLMTLTQCLGHAIPACDSFKKLDLSYCTLVTANGILGLLPFCACLEHLNVSGNTSVDDDFIHQLCLVCPTIQQLVLQKCVRVTNVGLCSLADFLWVEVLDITGCSRITDDGIEILTSACTGLLKLSMKKLNKITARTINAVSRACACIELLDVRECINISQQSIDDLKFEHQLTKVMR